MTTPKALLVACALLMGTAALADPVLTIDRAGLKKGAPGTLTLRLSNVVDNVSAYQIIIQFPPGAVSLPSASPTRLRRDQFMRPARPTPKTSAPPRQSRPRRCPIPRA